MIAKVLVGLMVISLGVINLIFPGLGHQIKYSLWVKDAEPTEFAVVMSRIGGVLLIIMGIVFMFK